MSSPEHVKLLKQIIANLIIPSLSEWNIRGKALNALDLIGRMEPKVIAGYAQHIIPSLDDERSLVRKRTIVVLGRMEPQVLAKYAQNIIPRLNDLSSLMRKRTIVVLGKLEPQVLSNYAQHIIPRLDDEDSSVCNTAIEALGKLEPQVLASYAQDIIELLDDEDSLVCNTALATLKKLPLLALVPHRHRLAAAPSLRGRVWLVRWRQLFWGEKLLLWWLSVVLMPGSRRAIATAREFYARAKRVKVG